MNHPPRILVIDDDLESRQLFEDILKPKGYELLLAKNGIEGMETAEKMSPDLILLDVMMPKIDGLRVQEMLKQNPITRNIPVIFITAKANMEDTVRAISRGAAGYIEKPFEVKRLLTKIKSEIDKLG